MLRSKICTNRAGWLTATNTIVKIDFSHISTSHIMQNPGLNPKISASLTCSTKIIFGEKYGRYRFGINGYTQTDADLQSVPAEAGGRNTPRHPGYTGLRNSFDYND